MTSPEQSPEKNRRCAECSGILDDIHGDLVFAYDLYTITVTDVPMQRCRACEERLVPGPVGIAVSQMVSDIHESMRQLEEGAESSRVPTDAITIHYAARSERQTTAIA